MFQYQMSPTGRAFHESDAFVKMLCGPYGSGKSCCCAVDVLANACAQNVAPDGTRYARVGVIRATYPEIVSATRKSLLEVLPSECGSINGAGAPMKGFYRIPLSDGTILQLELELWGLLAADDAEKIKSCNWTFAWMNEVTGIAPEIFSMVLSRIGRFPSMSLGGIRWAGVLMDYNRPPLGSWVDQLMKNPPSNYGMFTQPPAAFQHEDELGHKTYVTNPDAENLYNLGSWQEGDPTPQEQELFTPEQKHEYLIQKGMRFYREQIDNNLRAGREDVIQNQFCMLDVPIIEGKPVYSNFSTGRHVAGEDLSPIKLQEIILGLDQSGIHPAGVILQNQAGKWCVLDEMYANGEGLENFIYGILLPLLRQKYSSNPVIAAIDPSNQRDGWQAIRPSDRLAEIGITVVNEITNSPKARIQVVEHMLNLEVGGLLISPACSMLVRGFQSEYRYRRLRASGTIGAVYTPQPEKNDFSHVHDALQYAALLIHMGQQEQDYDISSTARRLADQRRVLSRVV